MQVGKQFPTSLIPAGFGLLFILFGALARTADVKRRALMMHIAVTLGLIGFLATAKAIGQYVLLLRGTQYRYPLAVEEKAAMALLMLVFVGLCVRSFVQARRARA